MGKPSGLGEPVVRARGAKVACYGTEGTGKTELVMSARSVGRVLVLDTEGRTQYYKQAGYGFEAMYSKSADDAIKLLEYAEELHAAGEKVVFAIDSFSSLWFEQQEVAERVGATRSGGAKFSSWAVAKRPLKKLYAKLFSTPVDVIITMRAKPRYDQKKGGEVVDYGYNVPDTERGFGYAVDLIIEMQRKPLPPGQELSPEDFRAVVVKSSGERDNAIPIGTVIKDPTFDKLLDLRLEGEAGGMEFDEDVLLQVGQAVEDQAGLVSWIKSLGLKPRDVKEQLILKFGTVVDGTGKEGLDIKRIPEYVEWTWELYRTLKDNGDTPF